MTEAHTSINSGQKGCYIYSTDSETQEYFKNSSSEGYLYEL